VAIDGSKFQVVASSRRHMNLKQHKRQEEKLDKRIGLRRTLGIVVP
jgi:transposase